jgi:hypothetical protein
MNSLEKYAAKKKLAETLITKLAETPSIYHKIRRRWGQAGRTTSGPGPVKQYWINKAVDLMGLKRSERRGVPFGAPTPKRLIRKPSPEWKKRHVGVPIADPNTGRIFSHKERSLEMSLPKKHRGPSWKDTHSASEQPGKPAGPDLKQPGQARYWKGAPVTPGT